MSSPSGATGPREVMLLGHLDTVPRHHPAAREARPGSSAAARSTPRARWQRPSPRVALSRGTGRRASTVIGCVDEEGTPGRPPGREPRPPRHPHRPRAERLGCGDLRGTGGSSGPSCASRTPSATEPPRIHGGRSSGCPARPAPGAARGAVCRQRSLPPGPTARHRARGDGHRSPRTAGGDGIQFRCPRHLRVVRALLRLVSDGARGEAELLVQLRRTDAVPLPGQPGGTGPPPSSRRQVRGPSHTSVNDGVLPT